VPPPRQFNELKQAYIVAITGRGQEKDKQGAREAGFDAHLLGPTNPAQLDILLEEAPYASALR